MYKGKRKMKALAVMCTALALGATTTGAMFSGSVWTDDTAIVASASQSVTFSAEKFGFGANSNIKGFNLVKGFSLIGTYNANQFLNGVTANVSEGTEARVFFEDGTVTYDAMTGTVLKNTRESGSTREYVTLDFKKIQGSGNGYAFAYGEDEKIAEISVCSISKGKGVVDSIKYLKNEFTIDTFFPNGLTAETGKYSSYAKGTKYDENGRVFTSDEIYLNDNKLSFEYEEDSEIIVTILQHHQGSSGSNLTLRMYRYDMFNDKLEEIGNDFANWGYALNSGRLAEMEQGDFESVEITTSYGTINSMTTNVGVYYEENQRATFTADEIRNKDFDIIVNNIGTAPFQTDIGNIVTVVYSFADGGKTAYKYLPYGEIKIADTRKGVIAKKPSGNAITTSTGDDVYNAVDEDGNITISAKTLGYTDTDETYHSLFHVYEGCERKAYIPTGDFNLDGYKITDYNPKKNYYVKVTSWKNYTGSDKNDKGYVLWYKYNPTLKAWVKTVDTREQEKYSIVIDSSMFPEAVNLKDNHGTVYCGDNAVVKFDNGDISRSDKKIRFELDGFKSYNYEVHIMGLRYIFCGVNAELANGTDEFGNPLGSEKNTVTIPVDFENGDGKMHDFTVDGKTEEGNDYHGEFKADNTADIEINLPDGEYDIVRDDGMFEHAVIDRDDSLKKNGSIGDKNSGDSDNGTYNSDGDKTFKDNNGNDVPVDKVVEAEKPDFTFEPYIYKTYSIEKPDGSEKVTGEIKGDSFDKLSDIEQKLPEAVYYNFETQTGVINSKEENSMTSEDGYLTVDDKKGTFDKFNLDKGDINLDGKIGVSDLVLAQKYLLNNLDGKTTFNLKNYVAMDVCVDENADVFDMVELRKLVIEALG